MFREKQRVTMHRAELVTVLEAEGDVAHLLMTCGSTKTGASRGTRARH